MKVSGNIERETKITVCAILHVRHLILLVSIN